MPATYRATYAAHEREPTPDSPLALNELCYTVDGDQVHLEAWLDRKGLEAMGQALPTIAARLSPPRRPRSAPPAPPAPEPRPARAPKRTPGQQRAAKSP